MPTDIADGNAEEPTLTHRREGGYDIPLLVWRLPAPVRAISSAVVGGGLGECRWVINASVPMSYDRNDPAAHLDELARDLGLTGPGVGLLTGVDVADVVPESDAGIRLWATVGLGAPIQAYDPTLPTLGTAAPGTTPGTATPGTATPGTATPGTATPGTATPGMTPGTVEAPPKPGTVNVVAWIPQRLSDSALVNAVATVTEAKTQAIRDLGLSATGTATDAVCILCPPGGDAAEYGGPRSRWGEPLARAAYRAVLTGGRVNLTGPQSWSERSGG
ncbi:adenosylcobinamide amidohydrolase [Actinoplanes sp. KI2]|uniref:adenosylcobinamide amidohydrolase n=1 Tax=Actinoplanes sp. KI2 TaxID=2983315 RepID=UPI0021D56BBD|nr:adenosylcobinamide amidohydrolase [Actinoplanes sp. KI2]MCU7725500.1 adenosylcobinamide amidohydrolase [Actinoplanes sp. KI2]